jgi:hypothetical protein
MDIEFAARRRALSPEGKHAIWTQVDTVQMDWQTCHTQGLVKIGDPFFASAVEVVEQPSATAR